MHIGGVHKQNTHLYMPSCSTSCSKYCATQVGAYRNGASVYICMWWGSGILRRPECYTGSKNWSDRAKRHKISRSLIFHDLLLRFREHVIFIYHRFLVTYSVTSVGPPYRSKSEKEFEKFFDKRGFVNTHPNTPEAGEF